uniref:FRG domain-containing protein n=1 Tax=Candidatus Kentrum sp. SD TaxID=2126332 RepID=A0A451BKV9_9GAMM|nr:MAG: FRG domain-containing protein [Candidatus Kentron sp. SD]VFK44223.1 MAG: FRG domain-containing protein [Candidatus Kentron sp. SD]VFK78929.1 MAG: FRG domain-containing protein [Candidatus Kentron sp. SD]
MKICELKSWHELPDMCRELDAEREKLLSKALLPYSVSSFLFRGQANAEWPLSDTLERAVGKKDMVNVLTYYETILSVKPEIELFAGQTLDDIPSHSEYQERLQSEIGFPRFGLPAYEYMVHLRHHGFPSPLLDWTRSPYIAAFFAFDERSPNADQVAIYAFIKDIGYGESGSSGEPKITTHGPYIKGHRRHFLQQAEYSVCTLGYETYQYAPHEKGFAASGDEQDARWKITLPASERDTALEELERMNITPYSLFGSEESLMKTIGRREFRSKRYQPKSDGKS